MSKKKLSEILEEHQEDLEPLNDPTESSQQLKQAEEKNENEL